MLGFGIWGFDSGKVKLPGLHNPGMFKLFWCEALGPLELPLDPHAAGNHCGTALTSLTALNLGARVHFPLSHFHFGMPWAWHPGEPGVSGVPGSIQDPIAVPHRTQLIGTPKVFGFFLSTRV
jgi:hypothetical protein